MSAKRFTLTKGFTEYERQIRDNGRVIMGCFHEVQARPIVDLLNALHEENRTLNGRIQEYEEILQSDNITDLETEIAKLREENQHIRHTIQWMLENERTTIGQNTLKQLQEVINND